jgi:hypothetical protein
VQIQADAPFRSQARGPRRGVRALGDDARDDPAQVADPDLERGRPRAARALQRLPRRARARQRQGRRLLGRGDPAVEAVAARALPEGYTIAWSGQAFQEKRTGRQSAIAFSLAIVMVFLILAALYERWLLPFAGGDGGALRRRRRARLVALRGLENDIYFQIGLVVLIGLAAKNAILIVEFAQQGFLEGKDAAEAALNAARLRFRPIVMTSLAFVLGVLPLMIATGAGAGARRSMGTGVVGGMLAATFDRDDFRAALLRRGRAPQETARAGAMKNQTENQGRTTFLAAPLALAVLAFLMSGCITVGPDYERPVATDLPEGVSGRGRRRRGRAGRRGMVEALQRRHARRSCRRRAHEQRRHAPRHRARERRQKAWCARRTRRTTPR